MAKPQKHLILAVVSFLLVLLCILWTRYHVLNGAWDVN